LRVGSTANQGHIRNGSLPICNVHIKARKPDYRPFPLETDKSLGACLKRRRLALELTQEEAALHFNVGKDSYQKWEWNEVIPNIKRRKLINQFLGFNYWEDGTGSLANKTVVYRIEHQLTRKAFGKILGISDFTIERMGKKTNTVSLATKNRILEFIELSR